MSIPYYHPPESIELAHEIPFINTTSSSHQSRYANLDEAEAAAESGLLLATEVSHSEISPSCMTATVWVTVNTLATIGIVFTNKAIFSDPAWKLCQLTFASFHFAVTWMTLYILSRPQLAYLNPRRAPILHLLPLAVAMCLNVVLPNLSLAYSSITFYQIARILLTPTVALLNLLLYGATLPKLAIVALIPVCLGVAMVSYYDSVPSTGTSNQATSPLGIVFAFIGIAASSFYTVWIASYHKKLQMSSMQLLYSQAPVAAIILLYAIPFLDTFPEWRLVSGSRWAMIALSGIFASLINISQFFVVAQTGPVSSTVVGHVKTCTIVAIGWVMSGRSMSDRAVIGIFVAISGIIAYSIVMLEHNARR
ncbi:hypothetical protein CDD82_1939 [Ophiocordyceps australis]|uniref:GDP-mannose transporter n=1 Tax=Ophiocordyceps australis TaxID=1399860 RepID=A0A2C5XWV5_9HYPO|nr:hypothetical protein CDD82_1939 [Ophiocordyceps australis]